MKKNLENSIFLIKGGTPPAATAGHILSELSGRGIQSHDLSLASPSLPLHLYLTCVYFTFVFPTYYNELSVNWLFVALNEFKLKGCQLQNCITFWDLQLSF